MQPIKFFLILFTISIPFWLLEMLPNEELAQFIPVNLPISALMFVCPALVAAFLLYREGGITAAKGLIGQSFDFRKIENRIWYIPIVATVPLIMVLSYFSMLWLNAPLPEPEFQLVLLPVFFAIFLLSALGEELGWQGYAFKAMHGRDNALVVAVIIGVIWAVWHIVPYLQADRTPDWIFWQCVNSVFKRILIVWIFLNAGHSIFAAALFHAMINVSVFMFPNLGSHYDPFITAIITGLFTLAVVFLWDSKSLSKLRFA
ncbi:MAG: CPBP family intramembrane metalloprotease [Pseudomonadales bacterium]|nr:CPBP family intramembrane metalloprotease [Pseudomonadales bacterium]